MYSAHHKLELWKIRHVFDLLGTALRKCPIDTRPTYKRLNADSVRNIGKSSLGVREGEFMSYETI